MYPIFALNGQGEAAGSESNSLLKPGLNGDLHRRVQMPQNFPGIIFVSPRYDSCKLYLQVFFSSDFHVGPAIGRHLGKTAGQEVGRIRVSSPCMLQLIPLAMSASPSFLQ